MSRLAVDPCRRRCLGFVATWVCVLAIGCTSQPGPRPCYPVHGSVRVKGKPAAGVLVAFYPQDTTDKDAPTAAGTTDADGRFSLSTYVKNDGAPAGDYKVRITLKKEQAGGLSPMRKGAQHKRAQHKRGPMMTAQPPPGPHFEAHVSEGPNDLAPFEIN